MIRKKKQQEKIQVADYLSPEKNPKFNTDLELSEVPFPDEEFDFSSEDEEMNDGKNTTMPDSSGIWEGQ